VSRKIDTLPIFSESDRLKKGKFPLKYDINVNENNIVALTPEQSNWSKCLDIIRDNVSPQVYKTWFEPLIALSLDESNLTVQVPSQFFSEWIEEHYYTLLSKTLVQVLGEGSRLLYHVVVDDLSDSLEKRTIKVPALKHPPTNTQNSLPFTQAPSEVQEYPSFLNPRYTLDNFIKGDSNQLAASAAMAITEKPGTTNFNPLFIFGDSGLGKTHLVQGMGNLLEQKFRKIRVVYTTCERFYMDFLNAIQNNKLNEFTYYYRMADVLIVDDIQFLSGKEKTQDNFFHTFNALHQAGKQIILTSDKHQRDLKYVDDRLISRFQWGLTADISAPDFEMKVAILKRKSEDEGMELPMDVTEYIAANVSKSVRELEGALISLIARVTLDNRPMNLDLAKEVVKGVTNQGSKMLGIEDIKKVVSDYYKISVDVMESQLRKHEVALARQVAMYLAKHMTQLSLKSIGAHFGGRDHSTVLHSCQAIENYFVTDKTVKHSYETMLKTLKKDFELSDKM